MPDEKSFARCGGSYGKRFHRRRRSRKASRTLKIVWLELAVVACSYGVGIKPFGTVGVMAFMARSPRMSSSNRMEDRSLAPTKQARQLDAASLEVARELIVQETSGSRRVTKKALLESIGYGVMDPLAYQTFENSPLPPKLRPTTHVRVAEGVHSFGQEFLGVPPREGVSSSSDASAPNPSVAPHSGSAGTAASLPYFALHPKLPGVGIRMTVLRLGNGELLVHSPVAPTVELLDMLGNSFPAVGSTTKMHLFSSSVSPEHWAFVKHWKEIFPLAEVWAVPGPHRRLMGVEVDHDIEHISGVPERLGGEVELAVLEGVPMVREAILLHRPTGTVLSAALLLAMDGQNLAPIAINGAGIQEGPSREPPPMLPQSTSPNQSPPSPLPEVFGQQSNGFEVQREKSSDADAPKEGRWRRLRWGLLDKTTTMLNMDTLAVFAPVKTLLHAFKGNSAAFSSRVLSWDAKIFVGCYGQSPFEGHELKEMLHAALGRYVEGPKDRTNQKKLGTRLKALIPGHRGGQNNDRDSDDAIISDMQRAPRFTGGTGRSGSGHGDAPRSPTTGTPRRGADPGTRALPAKVVQSNSESRANYFAPGARQTVTNLQLGSHSPRKPQTATLSPTGTFTATSANPAASGAVRQPGEARVVPPVSFIDSGTAVNSVREGSTVDPAIAGDDENRGFNLADMFSGWGTPDTGLPSATREEGQTRREEGKQAKRTAQKGATDNRPGAAVVASTSLTAPSSVPEVAERGYSPTTESRADISEVETRARLYLQEQINAKGTTGATAPLPTVLPDRTEVVGSGKTTASKSPSSNGNKAGSATAAEGGNPLVVGPDSRYDERPAASTAESDDDPFEAPFFPFADDGPFMN